MRKPYGGLWAALMVAGLVLPMGLGAADSPAESTQPARLLAIEEVEQAGAPALQVRASGGFSFTSYQSGPRSVVVDLTGVVSEPAARRQANRVAWVAHYRALPFMNASQRPVLRLDLSLARDCEVRLSQPDLSTLLLACPQAAGAAPKPASPPPASPAEPAEVRRLQVEKDGENVIVNVFASGPLAFETFTLNGPPRVVVDLPRSILLAGKEQLPVAGSPVARVRAAQLRAKPTPVTRVVVDLDKMLSYDVKRTPDGLQVVVMPGRPVAGEPLPPAKPATMAAASASSPTPSFADDFAGPGETNDSGVIIQKSQSREGEEPAPEPTLVASLAPTLPSTEKPSPETEQDTETVEMARAATPPPAAQQPPMPQQRPPAQRTEQPPPMELGLRQKPAEYTGEPISVNLKDVDLKDFFRLIHEISGLNIVIDPNVSGTVTLVLIDVPWDQALDIVLRNNGLASTLEGNVLRIATRQTLRDEQQAEAELREARQAAVEPVMVTRQLSYAQAADLEPTLRQFLSASGEIIRDERTNTLIIRDIPSVIPAIDNLIQQLDRKSLQVEIEARVVSASRAFARAIGSQLAFSAATGSRRSVVGGALGPSGFNSSTPVPPPLVASGGEAGEQPLVTDFPIAATSAILFGNRWDDVALDVILQAAESRNIAKVLSRPRLITQDNIEANVEQGTRIPVQTVVNNTISTQFLDVVLELTVRPQITADGTVFLDIHIENTAIDPGIARINGIPALSTQAATTQVLVNDGGTVVVGGVMVTNNSTTVSQVPLLGSIPIIGHLFKSTEVQTSTNELLFFITPRIIQS